MEAVNKDMPLRAFIAGEEILAPLLGDEAWESLRRRVAEERLRVVLPCCEVEGYLRRSKSGTRHFAHKKGATCGAGGETLEHLRAKSDIVLACHAAGYQATTEVAGEDWRADILATRGAARIAFEVQWSFLKLADALRRQRRYTRDGIRGCWFFRRPPAFLSRESETGPDLEARHDLPLFHLYANADGSFAVRLNRRLYPLATFVGDLLRGRVRFCESARAVGPLRLRASFLEVGCPACHRPFHIHALDTVQTAGCGLRFTPETLAGGAATAFHPAVLAALEAFRQTADARSLHLAAICRRNEKAAPSFRCPTCDAAFDGVLLDMALEGARQAAGAARGFEVTLGPDTAAARAPHWCYPPDGRFCCD